MKQFINYQHPAASKRFFAAILALALGGMAGSAYGASCSVSSSGVSFGVYNVFNSADNDSAGTVHVECTGLLSIGVTYEIELNVGIGSGSSFSSRVMTSTTNSGHHLNYNLYTNSSRTSVWGDGSAGTATVSGGFLVGIGSQSRDHDIFGRIPARQNAYVGSYSDTITMTINF
ncbi:MAG: spore coat U domain-containing protein [Methylococcales bacterium]|nr:spore coat U domain-containing protein [Methylococcales bacterium]